MNEGETAKARAATTVVYLNHEGDRRPVFIVTDSIDRYGRRQAVVRVRAVGEEEHLSIHESEVPDGLRKLTYYSPQLTGSGMDEMRAEAARGLGYENPERHANYVMHRDEFPPIVDENGQDLISRALDIELASAKAKYEKYPSIDISVAEPTCTVRFVLSIDGREYSPSSAPHVATSVGDIYFIVEEK